MAFSRKFLAYLFVSNLLVCSSPAFAANNTYIVKPGDTLWKLSHTYQTTVEELKRANRLTSDYLSVGQQLQLIGSATSSRGTVTRPENASWLPTETVIESFSPENIQLPKATPTVSKQGVELVEWFSAGKQLFKNSEIFPVTDCMTGKQLNLKVLSAGNHCDIEPATAADTAVMQELFPSWTWTPRPVIIHQDGRNIAGSLSGMPHSIDTTPDNKVTGHFDLYLDSSTPHGSSVSKSYVQQHYIAIAKAADNTY